MTTTATTSWDEWRAAYDVWTVADQRAFYDWVFDKHPDQARYDVGRFLRLLDHIGRQASVVELGGWDGGFAAAVISEDARVRSWVNWEISEAAVRNTVCNDPRYHAAALTNWYWESAHAADVFVASHVLEHLSFEHVKATFDASDCKWLFLQVPVGESPRDWTGYHGTHILEVGWADLDAALVERGYAQMPGLSWQMIRCYERDA